MNNKLVSLFDLIKLADNKELSEEYIPYLTGGKGSYRHNEILDVKALLKEGGWSERSASGFIMGYVIPNLGKEFDLLKITDETILNIELKSMMVPDQQIKKQLTENRHYLKILGKNVCSYCFVSSNRRFFKLVGDNLEEGAFGTEIIKLADFVPCATDSDAVLSPFNVLISPLNAPKDFWEGKYFLTEHQENIKSEILSYALSGPADKFFRLTGGPGTGKTLLLYDIAKDLANQGIKVMIVHSGLLCEGHNSLNTMSENLLVVPAKALGYREIRSAEVIMVDESHRLYESHLDKIERWVKKTKAICVFSYDSGQKLSHSEEKRNTVDRIEDLCGQYHANLRKCIRTNEEIDLFISCLRNKHHFKPSFSFPNVQIYFEPDAQEAVKRAKAAEPLGFTYISYTASFYDSSLDYQKGRLNTHSVIGQEFDGVCMIMDNHFCYENGVLRSVEHPSHDYIFDKLLYQGLTRARTKIMLFITDERLLRDVLSLVNHLKGRNDHS